MATKITNFTVHKNNKIQRDRKVLRADAVKQIKRCVSEPDIAGFAIVSWTDSGAYNTSWNTGSEKYLKPTDIPNYVQFTLDKEIKR